MQFTDATQQPEVQDDNVHHAETHVSPFITREDCSACFLVTEVLALLAPSNEQLVKL